MRSALIKNGKVVNVAAGLAKGYIKCPDHVAPGDLYDGKTWTRPVIPEPDQRPKTRLDLLEDLLVEKGVLNREDLSRTSDTP